MNADLAVVLSPGAEQAGLGWLLSWLGWLAGLAGMKINCFLKQFIGFLSHRRGSGTRAQNRRGWLGWAGLQSSGCSVPEDSVPFGRGPAGCGAAAN